MNLLLFLNLLMDLIPILIDFTLTLIDLTQIFIDLTLILTFDLASILIRNAFILIHL